VDAHSKTWDLLLPQVAAIVILCLRHLVAQSCWNLLLLLPPPLPPLLLLLLLLQRLTNAQLLLRAALLHAGLLGPQSRRVRTQPQNKRAACHIQGS
jgi:hypothetical protein